MRSTEDVFGQSDSILKDEPSLHTLPDGPESDSPSAEAAEPTPEAPASETPVAPKVEASATKPPVVKAADDDDEEEVDPVDQSLDGLKRALAAVRGDKRKERKKWREAETRAEQTARELAKLQGQLTAYQQIGSRQPAEQPKTPEAPKLPDFYGSPEEHLSAREKQLLAQWDSREKALRDEFSAAQFKRDATRSEKRMRREHEDYEDVKKAVLQTHPPESPFWVQMQSDPEPAEAVYEEGKRLLRGGKSEREAELEAKVAEYEAKMAGDSVTDAPTPKPAAKTPIPKSIASARGTGSSVKQAWNGPRAAKSIYD